MDDERLVRLEQKIDRLLALLDKWLPVLERFVPGRKVKHGNPFGSR